MCRVPWGAVLAINHAIVFELSNAPPVSCFFSLQRCLGQLANFQHRCASCWLKGMQGYVLNLQSSTHQRCFLDTLKWDQMGIGQMDGAETKQQPSKAGPKWCPNFETQILA
jgi:hypothetical protein